MNAAISAELSGYAARTLAAGSTSFAAAARLLDPATRQSAALLYAWCRYCDDVVDGQTLGHDASISGGGAAGRLTGLQEATRAALDGRPPPAPPFQALAAVAARHSLPPSLPMAHLEGFRCDVDGRRYETLDELLVYCWGVAGVVGIMMARIMGVRDNDTLDRAADLGLAFQLTNIARDIAEDAGVGRIYLPLSWLRKAGVPAQTVSLADPVHRGAVRELTARLVFAAEPFYRSALVGIGRLPIRSAVAIGAARAIYREIGRKVVRRRDAEWEARAVTSGYDKLTLASTGAGQALVARFNNRAPRDPALWRRQEL